MQSRSDRMQRGRHAHQRAQHGRSDRARRHDGDRGPRNPREVCHAMRQRSPIRRPRSHSRPGEGLTAQPLNVETPEPHDEGSRVYTQNPHALMLKLPMLCPAQY